MKTIFFISLIFIIVNSCSSESISVFPQQILFTPNTDPQGWDIVSNEIIASVSNTIYYAHPVIVPKDGTVTNLNGNFDFELTSDGLYPSVTIGGELSFFYTYTGNDNWEFSSLAPVRRGSAPSHISYIPSEGQVFPTVQLLEANNFQGRSAIWNFEAGTNAVVINIDEVISIGNPLQVCTNLQECNLQLVPGSQAAVQAWFDKGYQIIYIANRPSTMYSETVKFLIDNNFPAGVVRLADDVESATTGSQQFQTSFLTSLQNAGVTINYYYGSSYSNINAAIAAGVEASNILVIGSLGGVDGSTNVGYDFSSHITFIENVEDAVVPGITISGAIDSSSN